MTDERSEQTKRAIAIPHRSDRGEIRRNNLEVVLRHLSVLGPASRAEIAARAGLMRSTVSSLVSQLIELGIVVETTIDRGRTGRPATRLEIDGRHFFAVGAEINVDALTVVVTDLAGRQVGEKRRAIDAVAVGSRRTTFVLADLCAQAVEQASGAAVVGGRSPRVVGVSVAVPGLVDTGRGVVTVAPNLRWRDFELVDALRARLGWQDVPIVVGNDANFAVLAEYRIGANAGVPNLVYVTGEVGIGGGVIVDGELLTGSLGDAGEVGHMTVDVNGPTCGCGRCGCWEAHVGLEAFLRSVGVFTVEPASPEQKIALVAEKARSGSLGVVQGLDELATWVGIGVANLVNIFAPDVVVLGGYFAVLAEWVLPGAKRALLAHVLRPRDPEEVLRVSTLGFHAAAIGAGIYALDEMMSHPLLVDRRSAAAAGT